MKYGILLAISSLMILASCAGLRGHVRYATRTPDWTAVDPKSTRPGWLRSLPPQGSSVFAAGESEALPSKQLALEEAWATGLVRMGMTQFPELTRVAATSTESLRQTRYRRTMTLRLENVPWMGLAEATEQGSPYIERERHTGKFRAFRLLRWSKRDIATTREHMKRNHLLSIVASDVTPPPVGAHRAMRALSSRAMSRDRELTGVFKEMKCGVTLKNVIDVLGKPDAANPNNPHILEKDYRWGSFTLWRVGRDPRIAAITRDGKDQPFRVVCPSKWNN